MYFFVKTLLMSDDMDDEWSLLIHQVYALKVAVKRAEQQRDRANQALKASEKELDKFRGISDEMLERIRLEMKKDDLQKLKTKARGIINLAQWSRATEEELSINLIDDKIHHWNLVIKCSSEPSDDEPTEE